MTERMTEIAHAKINLALHVRARRPDGYHKIETLFAFAEDGDRLTAERADALRLEIVGENAPALADEAGNLVLRAAGALREAFSISDGASIRLDKVLPVSAGLGGGSADAAAAIRLLARLWGVDWRDTRVMNIARNLGADVPACLESRTCFGIDRGDALSPFPADDLAGKPLLLVNPGLPLSTGDVFRAWDGEDRGALRPEDWFAARNDLEAPAMKIVPQIGLLLGDLAARNGAEFVRMSGSGATCFALFSSDRACREAAESLSQFWTLATRIRGSSVL